MLRRNRSGSIGVYPARPAQPFHKSLRIAAMFVFLWGAAHGQMWAEELAARRALRQADLVQALGRQERWLGTDRNGAQWKDWLRSAELREQLEADAGPDALVLHAILERYEGSLPGLERPQFVGVRKSLARWIEVLPAPTGADLAQVARKAAEDTQTLQALSLEATRSGVLKSLGQVEQCLGRLKTSGAGWRSHLMCDELKRLTEQGTPEVQPLEVILARYDTGQATLERAEFLGARAAIETYCQQARWAQLNEREAAAEECLLRMAECLENCAGKQSERQLKAVGKCVAWCEAHGVAPQLVSAVRRTYGQPNLLARFRGDLMFGQFEQRVDERIPIRDSMNGASVRGSAHLTGRVTFALSPNDEQAAIKMLFHGSMRSQITGQSGPVGFAGGGRTKIQAEKWMVADSHEVKSLAAEAEAHTSMQMHSVWSSFRLPLLDRIARRVGWNQIQATRSSNEQNVSRKAERDFSRRFDQQASEMVAAMNESYVEMLRVPLRERGLFPSTLRLSTSRTHLGLRATLASGAQLAATTTAPELTDEADATAILHESLLNNLANTSLAGKTLESSELAAVLEPIIGSVPAGFDQVEGVPWALTLQESDPLEVRFSAEGLRVTIRSRRITAGAEQIDIPFAVSANYRGEIVGRAVQFTRQGGLALISPMQSGDWAKLNDGVTDSRAEIQQRFEMLLREQLEFTMDQVPLELPNQEFVPKRFETSDGWLLMTMDAEPAGQPAS